MHRALLLGFFALTAACGGQKTFESLCANQVPAPAACNTPCDPSSAAGGASCPDGYHCSPEGKCDTQCTPTGTECGDGYTCTNDGTCVSSGDGSGDPPIDANCPAVHFTATKTTPSIQLLIDRSGSMLEAFGNTQKYLAVQNALIGAQGAVSQLEGAVYFGASMYPSNACPAILAIGRAKNNAAAIDTFLKAHPPAPSGSGDNRNTPTPTSLDAVVADFKVSPPPQGSPPVIVLATDGLPNTCTNNNDTRAQSVKAAADAYAAGIRVFVLSVGTIANAATHLQELANAGQGVQAGQPNAKYYTGNNPAELAAAFQQIIGGVVSCDLKLSGQVDANDGQNGSVTLNGTPLTYGTDWTLDNDGLTIHLLGNACNTLKTTANPVVDASFSCGAVIF